MSIKVIIYIYIWFIPFHCYDDGQPPALPNIGNHVVINQKLSGFGTHFPFPRFVTNGLPLVIFMFLVHLRWFLRHSKVLSIVRVVPLAMDRAIKDIVSGIVQRSVCIACQTTKELVLKVGQSELVYLFLFHIPNDFLISHSFSIALF